MHPCLQVHEILANIFVHFKATVSSTYEAKESKYSELVSLATTCKTFLEPALDALWHTQPCLFSLLQTLPEDAFHIERKGGGYGWGLPTLTITRPLYPADYSRVYFYAKRIRSLVSHSDGIGVISPVTMALIFMEHENPRPPLLPALRTLAIQTREFRGLALYPRLVIRENVRNVCIQFPAGLPDDDAVQPISWGNLQAVLGPCAPQFSRFELFFADASLRRDRTIVDLGQLPQSIVTLFCSFHGLRTLDIRAFTMDHTFLHNLAVLPSLMGLHLRILSAELLLANFGARTNGFSVLTELYTETNDLAVFDVHFLRHISSRCLRFLQVVEYQPSHVWKLNEFFQSLQEHPSHPTLRELEILRWDHELWSQPQHTSTVDSATLASLRRFPQLRALKVTIDVSTVHVTDDDLQELATALPNLEVLRLFEQTIATPPTLTLRGLLTFASRLPLRELTLRVDCTQTLDYSDIGRMAPCRTLRRLNVCTSPITEYFDYVVAPIAVAFPALSELHFGWYFDSEFGPVYDELVFTENAFYSCWTGVRRALEPVMTNPYWEDEYDFT